MGISPLTLNLSFLLEKHLSDHQPWPRCGWSLVETTRHLFGQTNFVCFAIGPQPAEWTLFSSTNCAPQFEHFFWFETLPEPSFSSLGIRHPFLYFLGQKNKRTTSMLPILTKKAPLSRTFREFRLEISGCPQNNAPNESAALFDIRLPRKIIWPEIRKSRLHQQSHFYFTKFRRCQQYL